jgi:hypothetical protein
MHKEKIFLLLFWSIAIFLLGMNLWGNWAEKTYEKWKDSPFIWAEFDRFPLSIFKIARTRENYLRYVKLVSWIVIIFFTLITGAFVFADS